jgi:hypothetical protein
MALSTYGELRDEVASWLQRSDLATRVPTFIEMATSKFNRELRVPEMESRDTSTANAEFLALPDDFLEMRYVTGNGAALRYMNPNAFAAVIDSDGLALSTIYTLTDMQLRIYPAPTAAEPLSIVISYYERLTPLVNSIDTNWLLTSYPDVYLCGALVQACSFLHDDRRVAKWSELLAEAMEPLRRRKLIATGVTVDARGDLPVTSPTFDITTGL